SCSCARTTRIARVQLRQSLAEPICQLGQTNYRTRGLRSLAMNRVLGRRAGRSAPTLIEVQFPTAPNQRLLRPATVDSRTKIPPPKPAAVFIGVIVSFSVSPLLPLFLSSDSIRFGCPDPR